MATLEAILLSISPHDPVKNPIGSKCVVFTPEKLAKKASNESSIRYRVIYTLDLGVSYNDTIIELLGSLVGTPSEAWVLRITPPFFDRREATFLKNAEEAIKIWWQETGKTLYIQRAAAQIYSFDLNLAMVRCFAMSKDAAGAVTAATVDTWMFNRTDGAWSHWKSGSEILKP
jgi:hypothetical protein